MVVVAIITFAQLHVVCQLYPFLDLEALLSVILARNISHMHFSRASPGTTDGAECGYASNFGCPKDITCDTFAALAALSGDLFPGPIQGGGYYL